MTRIVFLHGPLVLLASIAISEWLSDALGLAYVVIAALWSWVITLLGGIGMSGLVGQWSHFNGPAIGIVPMLVLVGLTSSGDALSITLLGAYPVLAFCWAVTLFGLGKEGTEFVIGTVFRLTPINAAHLSLGALTGAASFIVSWSVSGYALGLLMLGMSMCILSQTLAWWQMNRIPAPPAPRR
jgi:hypothetical protein